MSAKSVGDCHSRHVVLTAVPVNRSSWIGGVYVGFAEICSVQVAIDRITIEAGLPGGHIAGAIRSRSMRS